MPTVTPFELDTVFQAAAATVRVRFSLVPKTIRATDSNDALTPANYSVVGPTTNFVQKVVPVPSDPNAVDLLMASPLATGTWVLAVTAVQSTTSAPITGASLLAFDAAPFTESISAGLANDEAKDAIRKNFNPAIVGPNIDALLAALATGDQTNWDNAKLALDQCFTSTASGPYLDRRAGDDGVKRPFGIGMDDDLFRRLSILVKTRKLTHESLWQILEVFYGPDAVRGFVTSLAEPYALTVGATLVFADDTGTKVTSVFSAGDFGSIGAATALEVAAAINAAAEIAGSKAYAVAFQSNETGLNYVRIYSGTLGLDSSVAVIGGRAQSVLQFPSILQTSIAGTAWDITTGSVQGLIRFTFAGGTDPGMDQVHIGDYVNIFGPFDSDLRGTFQIVKIKVDGSTTPRTIWFEVANTKFVPAPLICDPALKPTPPPADAFGTPASAVYCSVPFGGWTSDISSGNGFAIYNPSPTSGGLSDGVNPGTWTIFCVPPAVGVGFTCNIAA